MRRYLAAIGVAASLLASAQAWAKTRYPCDELRRFHHRAVERHPRHHGPGTRQAGLSSSSPIDPQFKVEQQVQDWKAWIAQGEVKAIMGWPINADAMVPVTQQAADAAFPSSAMPWRGRA